MQEKNQKNKIDDVAVATNSTKSLLTQNKNNILEGVSKVIRLIEDGHYDPLKALIFAKKLKLMGDTLEKATIEQATKETKLTKGEIYVLYDTEVTSKTVGASWDFSVCGDVVYDRMIAQLEELKESIKNRQDMLKTVSPKQHLVLTDTETGENFEVRAPNKLGTEGLNLKLR